MKIFIALILYLKLYATLELTGNKTICFYQDENCCDSLMENHTSIYAIPAGYSSLTIKFCSKFCLESVLIIANRDTVIVEGSEIPSKLTCHQEDTGIYIHKVTDLELRDIQLISCGNQYRVHMDNLTSSVYIINCTDVTIERFSVTNSHGNGVTMLNNRGEIMIEDSTFESSSMTKSGMTSGGNGLHIELSYCGSRNSLSDHCMNINHSQYRIRRCNFKGNNVSDNIIYTNENLFLDKDSSLDRNLGKGGGMCIVIDGYSTANSIQVEDCNFTANSAKWGGGLYLVVQEASQSNSISFTSCSFINNTCDSYAGGGANVGYQSFNSNQPKDNSITFRSCIFEGNHAQHGGGVSFYSTPFDVSTNKLEFYGCNWSSNTAVFGAAVKISRDALQLHIYDLKVKISFTNCNFTSNRIMESHSVGSDKSYETGRYAFLSVGCNILFKGDIMFNDNNGTALCMKSAEVEFGSPSKAQFSNNRGFEGGAMSLLGISTFIFKDDSKFTFKNNFAEWAGGAIFQRSYDNDLNIISRSCFLEYSGKFTDDKNVTFLFQNNTASEGGRNATRLGLYGHSIYATTIRHCFILPGCTLEENFRCIGNFTFIDENEYDVSTAGNKINGSDSTMSVIPGKIMKLPVMTLNELSKEVSAIYLVSVKSFQNSNVSVDSAFKYVSNKSVIFYGNPGDEANIVLETVRTRRIIYNLNIQIEHCPPGYANNKSLRRCECSEAIVGIHSCNNEYFEAKLSKGYWIGYNNNTYDNLTDIEFGKEDDVIFSFCPRGYCGDWSDIIIVLPQNSAMSALDRAVCDINRTGILCSKCREGFVLHYHGYDRLKPCRSKDNCKIGWLLYIISEIIPTTVFFAVVMIFNISFTDGVISGCVLFFQVSTTIHITAAWFPQYAYDGLHGYHFFSRIFHLDFFVIDSFSFCLWESASALDLIAFKYITILYASTLVVAIITAFKYCHSKRLNEILIKMKGESATSTKATIIHGVSGFLVICYSECIRISLLLLTPVKLHAVKDMNYHLVSFYDGEAKFFQGKHLFYGILALLIILIVGVLPPLILISYPLCYKVLALLKISETKFTKLLCKCIPLEKLKPFFDSFQRSYKDEYRFFSGLHFFYRLIALVAYANANLNVYYCILQVEFAFILTVHCICQPYKKHWHNILDALLFMILSTINALSLFNYHLAHNVISNRRYIINKTTTIQVVLLYVPIAYVVMITAVKIFKLVKKLYANRKGNAHENETNDYLEFFNLAEDRNRSQQ